MAARLLSQDDGMDIILDRAIIIVGRHPNCDARLDSPRVSRRHCCVAQDNGGVLVRDLGSTNGIRINGQRVETGLLRPGDELSIAHMRFRYEEDGAGGLSPHQETLPAQFSQAQSAAFSAQQPPPVGSPKNNGYQSHHSSPAKPSPNPLKVTAAPSSSGSVPVPSTSNGVKKSDLDARNLGSTPPESVARATNLLDDDRSLSQNGASTDASAPILMEALCGDLSNAAEFEEGSAAVDIVARQENFDEDPKSMTATHDAIEDLEEPLAEAVRNLLPREIADKCKIQVIVQIPK